jgi:hypothetical protein
VTAVVVGKKKEEFYVLGYNAVQPDEIQPTFRWSKSPPSCCLLYAGFLIELLFVSEEGGDMLLRNLIDFHQISLRYIPED